MSNKKVSKKNSRSVGLSGQRVKNGPGRVGGPKVVRARPVHLDRQRLQAEFERGQKAGEALLQPAVDKALAALREQESVFLQNLLGMSNAKQIKATALDRINFLKS